VCAVGDTTDEDLLVDLLCCSPHCDTAVSCRLLRSLHYASAALRLLHAASYVFLVTLLVLYYVSDSFFPVVPLSISIDTVLSHNYRITPVIKVIFWFFRAVC